jgi:hypothetical protein
MQDNGLSKTTIKKMSWLTQAHYCAKKGDIYRLEEILKDDPEQLDTIDCNGWTPLFYAAYYQKLKAVKLLFEEGADLTQVDIYQRHILHYAKKDMRPTAVSKYLKENISLSQDILENLALEFRAIIEKELMIARVSGKKILILLGELHGSYQVYQLEKEILKVLKEKGISVLLAELPSAKHLKSIEKKAQDSYKMNIIAIDKHPKRNNRASIEERNEVMAEEVNQLDQDAAFITGSEHLEGLLQQELIDRSKYHVVPFNLSSLISTPKSNMSIESTFAFDVNSVIQIRDNTFTDRKRVSDKWNEFQNAKKLKR